MQHLTKSDSREGVDARVDNAKAQDSEASAQSKNTVSLQQAVNDVLDKEIKSDEKSALAKQDKKGKAKVFKRVSSANALSLVPMSDSKKLELETFWIENFVNAEPKGFVATITPELAHYAVKYCMPRNRLTKSHALNKYCKAMLNGKWELNGVSIVVNTDGKIEDGGHRLTACYNSQTPLKTMVNIGQPIDAHKTIDRGQSRQLHDDLEFEEGLSSKLDIPAGQKGHTICRKIVGWMKAWRRTLQNPNTDARVLGKDGTGSTLYLALDGTSSTLYDEIKNTICKNPRTFNAIKVFEETTRTMPSELTVSARGNNRFEFIRLTGAATPLAQYIFLQPEKAKAFINRILNPYRVENGTVAQISQNDPAWQVRKYLLDNRGTVGNGMGKLEELYFRVVSAIHADWKDREISVLRQTKVWFPNWSVPIDGLYNEIPVPSEQREEQTCEQLESDTLTSGNPS